MTPIQTPAITVLTASSEQQAKIKALAERAGVAAAPNRVVAGATLPPDVELRALPADIGLGPYGFVVMGSGQIAIVDPDTRSVIQVF